jgi:hypothetical protein
MPNMKKITMLNMLFTKPAADNSIVPYWPTIMVSAKDWITMPSCPTIIGKPNETMLHVKDLEEVIN